MGHPKRPNPTAKAHRLKPVPHDRTKTSRKAPRSQNEHGAPEKTKSYGKGTQAEACATRRPAPLRSCDLLANSSPRAASKLVELFRPLSRILIRNTTRRRHAPFLLRRSYLERAVRRSIGYCFARPRGGME